MIKTLTNPTPKNFAKGQVVFYFSPPHHWWWGKVADTYSDGYLIEHYEIRDCRMIDGIPILEYPFGERVKKLPKGWTYNTELYHVTQDPKWDGLKKNAVVEWKPEVLEHLIDIGLLVKPSTQDSTLQVGVDFGKGTYRIVSKHRDFSYDEGFHSDTVSRRLQHSEYVCVTHSDVYATWEEVQKIIQDYYEESKRIANLSDYEYALEEMENVLGRWEKVYHASAEEIQRVRNFLLDRPKEEFEKLDIRLCSGCVQYKKSNNKKWISVLN